MKQQADFFFHNKSSVLPFSNIEVVLFQFQLMYKQRVDNHMNNVLWKRDVQSNEQD